MKLFDRLNSKFSMSLVLVVVCMGFSLPNYAALRCTKAVTEIVRGDTLSKINKALEIRIKALVDKYPQNVRIVEKVQFKFENKRAVKRRLLVVSLAGLDSQKQNQFVQDYLAALDPNTISFPLSESAGHLYSRFDSKVYDNYGGMSTRQYNVTGNNSRRLEPVLSLKPIEHKRMQTYIKNVDNNSDAVLGDNCDYDGIRLIKDSVGRINNNKPKNGGGHNCTSWIGLAPIGQRSERLISLIGATDKIEIHTNPGWWSYFITGAAKAERVPFVIYWDSRSSLEEVVTQVNSFNGRNFNENWDFSPH